MAQAVSLKKTLSENWRSGRAGAVGVVILGLMVWYAPPRKGFPGELLADRSYDLLLKLRPDIKINEAVILYMDEYSRDKLNQNPNGDWDRTNHVRLLRKLATYKPKAILFDVLFDLPSTPQVDGDLAEAIRLNDKVILAGKREESRSESLIHFQVRRPLRQFGSNNWGLSNLLPSTDRKVRQHNFDKDYPSLPWKLAEVLSRVPGDRVRSRWINYYGPPSEAIPSMGYYRALETNGPPLEVFTNKLVFIGRGEITTGKGTQGDVFPTPVGEAPGVQIQATACLNLYRRDWYTQLSLWSELLILVATGILFGYGLVLVRPWTAVLLSLAGIAVVFSIDLVLFWQKNLWFSWLMVACQIAAALAYAALATSKKAYRENEFLAEALAKVNSSLAVPTAPTIPQRSGPVESSAQVATAGFGGPFMGGAGNDATVVEKPGVRILADHELIRRVGQGAYGEVWLGRDVIGDYHALKMIYRKTFSSEAPYEREFNGIQKFTPISRSHPGFVHILHVGRNDQEGFFYYIMEVADDEYSGQTINPQTYSPNSLGREISRRGKVPVRACLRYGLELTSALEFLHQKGLIHRDIKPANIIFVDGAAKIADIGLVTVIAEKGREATYIGTEGYIPPEGPGTTAADVYSLGKVIYEASMGRSNQNFPAFPTTMADRADKDELVLLNEIICKACESDVSLRYKSAAEMHADLLRLKEQLKA